MTEGTLADVSHAHPETGETFGAAYRRGPAVADGGRVRSNGRGSAPDAGGDAADDATLADVDHEPPYPEPADVWARGVRGGDGA